jgi:integrase
MARRARSPFRVVKTDASPYWYVEFRFPDKHCNLSTGETEHGAACKRAADIWSAEARARGVPTEGVVPERPLREVAAECLTWAQGLGRAKTYASDLEGDLRNHILDRWAFASEVTSDSWDEAVKAMRKGVEDIDPRKCRPPLKWKSILRVLKHLRTLLKFCAKAKVIKALPALTAPTRADTEKEAASRVAMTLDDRDRFLVHIRERCERGALSKSDPARALRPWRVYIVLFYTGWRISMLERVLIRYIDWKKGIVRFPKGVLKNPKDWIVKLHPLALQALRDELASNPSIDPVDLGRAVFEGSIDHSNLFWASVKRLGIDTHGLTPHHVARHTLATQLGEDGVSTNDLQSMLCWSSRSMADRYSHTGLAGAERALGKLR